MSTADRHVGVERARRRSVAVLEEGSASANFSEHRPLAESPCRNAPSRDGQPDRSATSSIDSRRRRRASCGTRSSSSGVTGSGSTYSCSIRQGIRSRIPGLTAPRRRYHGSPRARFSARPEWRARPPASSARRRPGSRVDVTARGIDHLHATQLATVDVVREVKRMTGVKYSFGVAGSEIYDDARDSRTLRHKVTEAEFVVVPSEVSRQQLLAVTAPGSEREHPPHLSRRGPRHVPVRRRRLP